MKGFITLVKKHSLKAAAIIALFFGAVSVAPFKTILVYQPECPKELQK